MKVAVLMLSYNRFEMIQQALRHNTFNAGYDFDLFIWDNGSTDMRVPEFLSHVQNGEWCKKIWYSLDNKGISYAFNQMLEHVQHSYDAFVFMANDIKEPNNWLADRVRYLKAFPRSGMISISPHQVRPDYPEMSISGMPLYAGDVIGQFMISRQVLEKVGAFREDFGEYGPIDNDYNYRCSMAGFVNYYIPGKALHMDDKDNTQYGYDKQQRIEKTWLEHVDSLRNYDVSNIYIPLTGEHTINMKDNV